MDYSVIMTTSIKLGPDFLRAALTGYEQKQAEIEAEIAAIRQQLGVRRPGRPAATPSAAAPVKKKRKLSTEARQRMADAQKRRWAARRTDHTEKLNNQAQPID